jgi:hypothetical protein
MKQLLRRSYATSEHLLALLIPFFFLIPVVFSQTIGIGVEPSLVNLTLVYGKNITVNFKFWNEGDTDAVYTVIPESNLLDCISLDSNYWHNETFIVPNKTQRLSGFVTKELLFTGLNKTTSLETGISIYAAPVGEQRQGMVTVKRNVFVKMFIENYLPATTTTTSTTMTSTTTPISTGTTGSEGTTGEQSTTSTTASASTTSKTTSTSTTSKTTSTSIISSTSTTTQTTTVERSSFPIIYIIAIVGIVIIIVGAVLYTQGLFPFF